MAVFITKSDGTSEPFDEDKLIVSLRHAGAEVRVASAVAHDVEKELWSGISTQEIYARAFARLREHKRGVAARYSLKRAVMEFGPSGFPFEEYIAELFRAEGFRAEVGQMVQGACVEHEVDVVIHKKDATVYTEAKFHNTIGFHTDLKTVLYIQARINDIREAQKDSPDPVLRAVRGLVVTNTKFTDKAIQYAQCQGLELLGWDYPAEHNLHSRIDRAGLYPVTALTTLTPREKVALLNSRVVLCRSLPERQSVMRGAGLTGARAAAVLEEVGALCVPGKDI